MKKLICLIISIFILSSTVFAEEPTMLSDKIKFSVNCTTNQDPNMFEGKPYIVLDTFSKSINNGRIEFNTENYLGFSCKFMIPEMKSSNLYSVKINGKQIDPIYDTDSATEWETLDTVKGFEPGIEIPYECSFETNTKVVLEFSCKNNMLWSNEPAILYIIDPVLKYNFEIMEAEQGTNIKAPEAHKEIIYTDENNGVKNDFGPGTTKTPTALNIIPARSGY